MTAVPTLPTIPALLDADEFARRYGEHRMELVRGRLKVLNMPGARHGKACARLTQYLGSYADTQNSGHVFGNDTFVQTGRNPDTVRGADAIYISYERLPRDQVPDGVLRTVPELVVEVRSPSDEWADLFAKVEEYLDLGVPVVMVLDSAAQTVSLYRRTDPVQTILGAEDVLTLPDVLPGFTVPVRKLFE